VYKIGLSGQMFDERSIWEHLEAAARIGYDCVELRSTHVYHGMPEKEKQKIRKYLNLNGIRVTALSCFVGNFGLSDDCEEIFKSVRKYIELAVEMDADMVRVWPAWQASKEAGDSVWEKTAVWMRKCGKYAASKGRRIVMEMHHGTLCDTAESSLKLLDMIGCDAVGLTLDPVNLYQVPTSYTGEAIRKIGKHIFNVHIKDIVRLDTGNHPAAFPYSYYVKHIGRFTPVKYTPEEKERFYAHRRIGQGGVDWHGVFAGLAEIGYTGAVTVESVDEQNPLMPSAYALAERCYSDVKLLLGGRSTASWHRRSPEAEGMFKVISPEQGDTRYSTVYRLNLAKGKEYTLETDGMEMNPVVVKGSATIKGTLEATIGKYDSFYLPGKTSVTITATEDLSLYIGAAVCEGYGIPFVRKYASNLPIGEIHQIHGRGSGKREVFFTLNPEMEASRLICGITWSDDGQWTSWPPHQHESDLEEVYCYFDMRSAGLHFSYLKDAKFDTSEANVVRNGSMVVAPVGYHPTVACPGSRNVYLWILTAHSHEQRRYDLAVEDPDFSE